MRLENKEEEDLPSSKTALTHRYNDSKTTYKNAKFTAIKNDTDNTMNNRKKITRKQKNPKNYETKMGRKITLWAF